MKLTRLPATMLALTFVLAAGCSRQPSSSNSFQPASAAPAPAVARPPENFDRASRPGGTADHYATRIDSAPEGVANRSDANVSQAPPKGRSKLRSAEIIGGTAGVGAAIGALAGGGKGAAIGALAGGGGGLIYDRATAHKKAQ